MSYISIDHEKCIMCETCVMSCPFSALSNTGEKIEVSSGCRLCRACINVCPVEAISLKKDEVKTEEIDKSAYKGILVYGDHDEGHIQSVTYELLGKAIELAKVRKEPVYALLVGKDITPKASLLRDYGADRIMVYDDPELEYFRVDNYTNIFEDCINRLKPSAVLVGATTVGRSLAPSTAARFKTGLTADTTVLEMREDGDLVQIRPAFGGNIMARILTTKTRPQFATVREKVMEHARKVDEPAGTIEIVDFDRKLLASKIEVLDVKRKPAVTSISDAEIIVAAGQGVHNEEGMNLVRELAKLLNGIVGYTRPLVEKGIGDNLHQIGLSGRSVKPKLIITCGISGAIQFTSGMDKSDIIIAINNDPEAPIFKIAHYGVHGDLYEILPQLIKMIKEEKKNA